MPSNPTGDPIDSAFIDDVRDEAEQFDEHIQERGRDYFRQGRVGALRVEPARVSAPVLGTRTYRTAWEWTRDGAASRCSCPAAPSCKHAYALAIAMGAAGDEAPEPRERQPYGFREGGWVRPEAAPAPWEAHGRRQPPAPKQADELLAADLAEWARRRSETHPRSLRAVMGVEFDAGGNAAVWLELRVTSDRLRDAPRSRLQIQGLASELRGDPSLLAPPDARLLRVVARSLTESRAHSESRLRLEPSAINRMLDSFADSPLVTWEPGADAMRGSRGGIERGARLRLGDAAVDLVPVSAGAEGELHLSLAVRWPGGRTLPLVETLYFDSDDELNPSLVLAEGQFWRVADSPPSHVVRRLARGDALAVPKQGREKFLASLATSFGDLDDALGSHLRVHPTRPLVTLDLDDDDWIHVRLFAHTGGTDWRPGAPDPGVTVFELDSQGDWIRLGGPEAGGEAEVWIEIPDPEPLAPVREWLASLPFARQGERLEERRRRAGEVGSRGGWIFMGASKVHQVATAWEQRPLPATYLGNDRMRGLLAGPVRYRSKVTVNPSGVDFFSVSASWEAEGMALTEADIAKLRASSSRFVKLSTGWASRDWVEGFDEHAELLADLGIEAGAGAQRVSLAQLARARPESLERLHALGADADSLAGVARLREAVAGFAGTPRVALPRALEATLRPYQHDGLDFLAFVTGLGFGAVLADDMGLGKTVQALAWIEWLRERDPAGGPVLVVCPASVVHNWQREAERFTPGLRTLVLASGEERHALRREVPQHDLVITNYALMRRDVEHWKAIPLRAAILDEAQNIKNPKAAVSRAALDLNARHRLALTGTPIENRALDLWSIMEFVNPGYLGRRSDFVARFDQPDGPAWTRRLLAARLRPVMLRRLKEQVAPDLPDRIEERLECELTPGQRRLYLAELMRGRETVERLKQEPGGLREHHIEVLALLTRLRQVCCHPALVGGRLDVGSGKFDALFDLLEPLMAEGRKVLVFSQFVECLKLLAAETRARGIQTHLLTGATTRRDRVVDAFERDPEPCVFLISLKAGGTGLNLTAAQYVVVFDPWWNPAVEAQAIDRTHRIGQTRTVIAYRLMAAGTVEEKIWELQQRKQRLVQEVLGEDGFARALTPSELEELLA